MKALTDAKALDVSVRRAVAEASVIDIHTHLFPPSCGSLLQWGIDELLTYHYLVAELFTVAPRELTAEAFWKMPKSAQADLVWEHVFLRHGALSEAARGVVATLNALGLDAAGRDLSGIRKWFAARKIDEYLPRVFQLAGVRYAIMTNDPFRPEEAAHWNAGRGGTELLRPALRVDPLIVNWPAASKTMLGAGYALKAERNQSSYGRGRNFLADWAAKMKPVYLAASLPHDFRYPTHDLMARVMMNVVLPTARACGLPVALMIGVRRGVNPHLRDGGDAVGVADVSAVANLCAENPDIRFLVTMLSRVNQHELCVTARKFRNLHVFGCWWFCNTPSIVREITRQRLELLGTNFTANHSDARVLDQLLCKWSHTRQAVADSLAEKYALLWQAGWRPTEDEVRREVNALFGGAFEGFIGQS